MAVWVSLSHSPDREAAALSFSFGAHLQTDGAAHVSFLEFVSVPHSPLKHRHSETVPHLTLASSNSEASQTCHGSVQSQVTMAEP